MDTNFQGDLFSVLQTAILAATGFMSKKYESTGGFFEHLRQYTTNFVRKLQDSFYQLCHAYQMQAIFQ